MHLQAMRGDGDRIKTWRLIPGIKFKMKMALFVADIGLFVQHCAILSRYHEMQQNIRRRLSIVIYPSIDNGFFANLVECARFNQYGLGYMRRVDAGRHAA